MALPFLAGFAIFIVSDARDWDVLCVAETHRRTVPNPLFGSQRLHTTATGNVRLEKTCLHLRL